MRKRFQTERCEYREKYSPLYGCQNPVTHAMHVMPEGPDDDGRFAVCAEHFKFLTRHAFGFPPEDRYRELFKEFKIHPPKQLSEFIPQALLNRMAINGEMEAAVMGTDDEIDFFPVVRLHSVESGDTYLLASTYPKRPTLAYGLVDCVETQVCELSGEINLIQLVDLYRDIKFDPEFVADKKISEYARLGRQKYRG